MSRVESPGGVHTAVYGEKGPHRREYVPIPGPAAVSGAAVSGAAASGAVVSGAALGAAVSGAAPGDAPEPEDPPALSTAPFPPETDFQWDERGFLVLLRSRDAGGAFAGEFRYEYGTDDRGNWTLRRETEMVRRPDILVPVFRGELRRRITYAGAGE
jgi:hypothetical protein